MVRVRVFCAEWPCVFAPVSRHPGSLDVDAGTEPASDLEESASATKKKKKQQAANETEEEEEEVDYTNKGEEVKVDTSGDSESHNSTFTVGKAEGPMGEQGEKIEEMLAEGDGSSASAETILEPQIWPRRTYAVEALVGTWMATTYTDPPSPEKIWPGIMIGGENNSLTIVDQNQVVSAAMLVNKSKIEITEGTSQDLQADNETTAALYGDRRRRGSLLRWEYWFVVRDF